MTNFDLVLRGGAAILPGRGRAACDIAICDGRIAAIVAPGEQLAAATEISVRGLTVFPGALDVHLHLGHGKDIAQPRVPLDADRETAAAAKGGVTCFIPYLMATEPFENIFDDVVSVTQSGARIDFSYHFIISTEEQLAGVPVYVRDYGVPTFKIFMNNRGGEGARLGLPDIDDGFLFRLCEAAAGSGGMVCPHPETIEIAWVLRDRLKLKDPDGKGGLATWNATRPPFVEADAVQRAAYLASTVGAPLYVVHTSSEQALLAALRHRRDGVAIHIETCPHYLTHDVSWSGGDMGKINPPLREASDREALWRALLCGDIDTVATDLTDVIEHFTEVLGLSRYALFVFDYGAPVGLRLAVRHPERVTALISQSGNAYVEGLSEGWNPIQTYWKDPSPENRTALRAFLKPETTQWQYTHGVPNPERLSPDAWTFDSALLARPGNDEIQLDLFGDYQSNVALYPKFQEYIRTRRPPLLAVWGKNDPFFLPAGAQAFKRDNPDAEIHLLNAGHFALESQGPEIAVLVRDFLGRKLSKQARAA